MHSLRTYNSRQLFFSTYEQKLCLETFCAIGFLKFTECFRKKSNFSIIAAASTEKLTETRTCLCLSCNAFSIPRAPTRFARGFFCPCRLGRSLFAVSLGRSIHCRELSVHSRLLSILLYSRSFCILLNYPFTKCQLHVTFSETFFAENVQALSQ